MADATYNSYKGAANVAEFEAEKAKIPVTDSDLKQQAVTQYEPTRNALTDNLNDQMTAMITSQASDEKLITDAANKSANDMRNLLVQRGIDSPTGITYSQDNAIQKQFNEVMTQRKLMYAAQRKGISDQQELLKKNYDVEIQRRMATNRYTNVATLSDILTQISTLQSNAYKSYAQYLLNKKSQSSGGGGYSRRSGSSSGSSSASGTASGNDYTGKILGNSTQTVYSGYTPYYSATAIKRAVNRGLQFIRSQTQKNKRGND